MRFVKMHGIGNDYVYIDGAREHVADPAALAQQVSDRHLGVGADGLILVLPPEPGVDAHVRMRMFNADGSESEMCGNGVRCVAKFAYDRALARAKPLRVQTGRGVLTIDYALGSDGRLRLATVDMGQPILDPASIPIDPSRLRPTPAPQTYAFDAQAASFEGVMVSMGNPHVVIFEPQLNDQHLSHGRAIEHHPAFPRRINVHFVKVLSRTEVVVKHWERGSGPTLACGTGACAVCVAGVLRGLTERSVTAHLPGGDLQLEWRADDSHVHMTGPAVEVFTGDWPGD